MSDLLLRAIARFRRRPPADPEASARISAAAFRSAVEQRLGHLERDLGELKARLNGLLFLVAGAVITQVILKLVQ